MRTTLIEAVLITPEAWYAQVVGLPTEPIPPHLEGREEALMDAMETGGSAAVRPLIEAWGLVWTVSPHGVITVDVLPGDAVALAA